MIRLACDKTGFTDEQNRPFIPFGVNYYDHLTGWAPKIWSDFQPERVREQFRLMREYGVNTARFFLASTAFMLPDGHLNPDIRPKFEFYLDCARETGIRVIPTGPDHWEGQHSACAPDLFCGQPYLAALRNFWSDMIPLYGQRDEIFAWDLRNEPMVGWDSQPMCDGWQTFLREKYGTDAALRAAHGDQNLALGSVPVPPDSFDTNPDVLWDYQLYREQTAYAWTKNQTDIMRANGCGQLITIGYIQWSFPGHIMGDKPSGYAAFDPRMLAPLLDFDCAHFYPVLGDPFAPGVGEETLRYGTEWVRYCDLSRPVVLEEYGYYGGGAINEQQTFRPQEHLDRWNTSLVERTKGLADGWLSWPFVDTPSSLDISKFGGLLTADLQPKPWGTSFRRLAEEFTKTNPPAHSADRVPFAYSESEKKRLLTRRR